MKRIISIIICLIMVLSVLCGCGNTADTNNPADSDGKDLGGRTFKIMVNGWNIPDLKDEKDSFAQTAKKFGCNFEFIEFSDEIATYNNLVMSYLAGTADYDALVMRGYNVCPLYSASGVILNMSKHYDFKTDKTWSNPLVSSVGVWRGDRYGLPVHPVETGYAIWYNKSMLSQANIPDLWEYVENNTWTFETFREVCKKLTQVKNGKTTVYGFAGEEIFSSFMLANGGTFIDINGEKAQLKISEDANINAMQYVLDLYNVDKSIPSKALIEEWGNPSVLDMFSTGKVAMTAYGVWAGPAFQNAGMKPENLGWIYFPKGEDATDYVVPGLTPPRTMVVPSLAKNPEDIVAVLADALGYWGETKEYPKTIESYYDEVLENDQMLDILVGNNKKCYIEGAALTKYTNLYNYEGILNVYGEMTDKLLANELTPKAAVESYSSKIQSKIDVIENGINLEDYE
ncbi:MAG: extracellular solute-binding protein [Ruminococcaceae bacterium]|nr:extracellular solute-binding protein [Oscillospiraceae bacterium]